MKNLFLLLLVAMVATTSYGQLKVFSNGDTYVGDNTGVTAPAETLEVNGLVQNKGETILTTGSSATVLVNRTDAAIMAFGAGIRTGFAFDATSAFEVRSNSRAIIENRSLTTGALRFFVNGADGRTGIGTQAPTAKLHVIGNIFTTGAYQGSDKALKTNMNELTHGLDAVMALNPISYNYKEDMQLHDNNIKFGVVAQEMQKVMPELVSSFEHERFNEDGSVMDKKDFLMIDDTAIKYVLINAIQEQQAMIEAQNEKIAQMEEVINTIGSSESINKTEVTLSSYDLAELNQNTPNPFNGTTSISYIVPTDASSAQISIFGTSGQLMKTLDIEHVGQGTLDVNAQDLPAGTYTYQLIVNNRMVETKKMVMAN